MLEYYQLYLNELKQYQPSMLIQKRRTVSAGPLPAFSRRRFSVGKSELIHGAPYLASPSFAEVLTGMGYAVWSIDAWDLKNAEVFLKASCSNNFY